MVLPKELPNYHKISIFKQLQEMRNAFETFIQSTPAVILIVCGCQAHMVGLSYSELEFSITPKVNFS